MAERTCSLFINAARPDVPFLRHTVPHLSRGLKYPFQSRVLVMDTAALPARYAADPTVASREGFTAVCESLRDAGHVDQALSVDYYPAHRTAIYEKHYGKPPRHDHDFRGGPVYPYLYAIENIPADYLLHFDADMMLHQPSESCWVTEGIKLMEDNDDLFCVCPHPGPPGAELVQPEDVNFQRDPRGFYRFPRFTARRFLIHRRRFESMLPLRNHPVSRRHRLRAMITGRPADQTWELLLSEAMLRHRLYRADIMSGAWTLHPIVRGSAFLDALPSIIARIERGEFPAGQAGHYDLRLNLWTCSR